LNEVAAQGRFLPSSEGIRILSIQPMSIFAKLGLQGRDTVQSVNGIELSSPDRAIAAYASLRNASHLTLGARRSGGELTFDYVIR